MLIFHFYSYKLFFFVQESAAELTPFYLFFFFYRYGRRYGKHYTLCAHCTTRNPGLTQYE
jgi:hypothetical protein